MSARTFASLREGETTTWEHLVTTADVDAFVALSGDDNPLHVDDRFARRHGFRGRVVHGMLVGAFLSRVVGTALPGPGVVWMSQTIRFAQAVYIGDRIAVAVTIKHKAEAARTVVLDTVVRNGRGETVFNGEARMMMLQVSEAPPWTEQVVVVTGAGRGIGAAVARALGARGARVVVNYRSDGGAAEAVVADVAAAGGAALAVQADVSTPEGARGLADAALERFGRVDAVVNNATPPIERKPLLESTWEEVDRYWNTYVQAAFTLMQAVVPGMADRGYGRVVHVLSSAMWGKPPVNNAGYVAAKSGLWGLAKASAVELGPLGITVNAVSPSAVMTDQWQDASDNQRRALAMSVPVQRLADPEEVAGTVLFLLGPEGAYLTGANLPVSGGEVM
jgi:3-oxoacyl-[acyl-carrier protein] reductase